MAIPMPLSVFQIPVLSVNPNEFSISILICSLVCSFCQGRNDSYWYGMWECWRSDPSDLFVILICSGVADQIFYPKVIQQPKRKNRFDNFECRWKQPHLQELHVITVDIVSTATWPDDNLVDS